MNGTTKECEQLCQEAAEVISCGGGFQFFNILYGGGGMVQKWAIPIWKKVAEFCRKREFCHKATPVYQIGIMLSEEVINEDTSTVYTAEYRNWQSLCSWNNALLDCGFSTNVIFES